MIGRLLDRLAGVRSPKQREREAEERWRMLNAQRRAEGCRCGEPATHVARIPTGVGAAMAEIWSCAEHVGVNSWSSNGDGTWTPGEARLDGLKWPVYYERVS